MKRSIGITVIAVLSLLGSLFVFLMGLLIAVLPFFSSKFDSKDSPFSPGFFKLIMVAAAFMYLLPAIWGIATSVGLFRLKEWARISIIIFSVLLLLMFGFGTLIFLVMPFPTPPNQPVDANVASGVRTFMSLFAAGIAGIGVWWLVFFTRATVKQQFVPLQPLVAGALEAPHVPPDSFIPSSEPSVPTRPLSFTIIAWLLLAGCLFMPINLLLRYPAVILTNVVTGWPATLFYLIVAAVSLYVGIGLLRFQVLARSVGIAYYVFFFANMAVFYLAPGGRARMLDLMQKSLSSFPWMHAEQWQGQFAQQFNSTPLLVMGSCFGLVGMLVPVYFLITRKQAFEKAAAAAANRGPGAASANYP